MGRIPKKVKEKALHDQKKSQQNRIDLQSNYKNTQDAIISSDGDWNLLNQMTQSTSSSSRHTITVNTHFLKDTSQDVICTSPGKQSSKIK